MQSLPKIAITMWGWLLYHRALNQVFGFHSAIPDNSPHTLPSSIRALTFQEIPRILSLPQCVFPAQTEGISQESVEQKHKQTPVPWLGLWSGMPNTSPCSLSRISPAPWVTAGGHSFESHAGPPMIYHPLTVFVLKIPSWELHSPSPPPWSITQEHQNPSRKTHCPHGSRVKAV